MPNILTAIKYIVSKPIVEIKERYVGKNRINNIGDALELYIKDSFAETVDIDDELERMKKFSEVFSYLGNTGNPPDLMIKGGDAIEIKKIESIGSGLALNSSYPKDKLYVDNKQITKHCVECEEWQEKDMLYVIGHVNSSKLHTLWFVYGDCYAANKDTYEKVRNTIVEGIKKIENVDLGDTTELGRVNKIDPLGITYLRVRGMWHIENPKSVFSYLYTIDKKLDFQLICIMQQNKYNSFPEEDRKAIEAMINENFVIEDVNIKNPNNPAKLINAKLITFKIK